MGYQDAERIMAEVALRFDMTADMLRGSRRTPRLVRARRHTIRRLREETNLSWREIGIAMGLKGPARDRTG